MALTDKQRGVRQGIMIGAVLTIAGLAAGMAYLPTSLTVDSSMGERLAYALKADILVIFWLLHSIGRLAGHRFFTPEDIDGSGLTAGTDKAKVLQSVLQNTLEQSVLAITLHLIWAVVMPVTWMPGIPAAAILFFIGRMFFVRGYTGGAPARALGFSLTFYPSMLMLLIIIAMLVLNLVK